jgi:hypothetical protein
MKDLNVNRPIVPEDSQEKWNKRILQLTAEIKNHYPSLIVFLKEPVPSPTLPVDIESLKSYYDSLNSLINDYVSEQA